jgi:hypothetical protein
MSLFCETNAEKASTPRGTQIENPSNWKERDESFERPELITAERSAFVCAFTSARLANKYK